MLLLKSIFLYVLEPIHSCILKDMVQMSTPLCLSWSDPSLFDRSYQCTNTFLSLPSQKSLLLTPLYPYATTTSLLLYSLYGKSAWKDYLYALPPILLLPFFPFFPRSLSYSNHTSSYHHNYYKMDLFKDVNFSRLLNPKDYSQSSSYLTYQ